MTKLLNGSNCEKGADCEFAHNLKKQTDNVCRYYLQVSRNDEMHPWLDSRNFYAV